MQTQFRYAVTALFVALAAGTAPCDPKDKDTSSYSDRLDAFIESAWALDLSPGMALVVVQGDRVVYSKGFGYADLDTKRRVTPETLFYVASTSKSFTAFAVALLDHRGKLDLDAPLSRLLPDVRLQEPLSAASITMRDLLTHTHGIANGGPVVFRTAFSGEHTHEQLVRLLSAHEPASSGKAFQYGNIGYNVAGLALDATQDVGFKELLQREVFRPLGMTSTSARLSSVDRERLAMPHTMDESGFKRSRYIKGDGNMHAAGGHVTTVSDLAKWLEVHMNGGRLDGRQVFPAEVVSETHRKQADQDRDFTFVHRYGWGLGWDLGTYDGDTVIHRHGGFTGFHSHLSFMPEHRIGVIVLVNDGGLGPMLAHLVPQYVYDLWLDKPDVEERYQEILAETREKVATIRQRVREDRARRASRPQELPHPREAYAGTYENSDFGRMTWRVIEGKLQATIGLLQSAAEVYDGKENQLRVELRGGGEVVGFHFDGDRADSLMYAGARFQRVAAE